MSIEAQVVQSEILSPLTKLTKDLAKAAVTLSAHEARFLVDYYYTMQGNRIAADHQVRMLDQSGEPHEVLKHFAAQNDLLESQVKRALDKWTDGNPVGVWAKSICGIGPVIAAGLLAHIDASRSESVGSIWSFAGLNPDMVWKKGEKRPFNANLKTLCAFKLGESFVKVQNNENDVYGKLFAARKRAETEENERGAYAEIAKRRMETVRKETDAYKAYSKGMLPPAHIHARARRYAVKLFLAHYHTVAYFVHYQHLPPAPYVFSHLEGHIHYIRPPHAEMIEGLIPALDNFEGELRSGRYKHQPLSDKHLPLTLPGEKIAAHTEPPAAEAPKKTRRSKAN